jgi:ureidoglycolate lyase
MRQTVTYDYYHIQMFLCFIFYLPDQWFAVKLGGALINRAWQTMSIFIQVAPLTRQSFTPFGEVLALDGAERFSINQGTCQRYHDLAHLDLTSVSGDPIVSIFKAQPLPLPLQLGVMERHPLSSQVFYPLQNRDWLVVVALGDDPTKIDNIKAFRCRGDQGVNYARNTWHHPLLVLEPDSRFIVIDRRGPGNNLEEVEFRQKIQLKF